MAAQAGDGSITLTWNDPSDANISHYEYRVNHTDTGTGKLSGWSPWAIIPNSSYSTTSHTFPRLTNGKEYRYKIRAATEILEDLYEFSKPAPGVAPYYVSARPQGTEPPPVSQFWAVRVCDHHFKVRWERVSGATGYDLNISNNNRKSWKRVMTNKDNNAWEFWQWSKNKTYWFAIRAVNAHGASVWKDLRSVALPCPVEGLSARYASNGDVSVDWKPAKRASVYDVNFSSDGGRSWERMVSNLSATSYSFNRDPQTLPYNPNFLVAVQSRKGSMSGGWRNAPITRPELTASDITTTTAELTLVHYSGAWWYERIVPGGDDTCHSVAVGTSTAALSNLDADNSYTYKAYSAAGCGIGDEITSVTFRTQLTVSNLSQVGPSPNTITQIQRWAAGFTTGSHPAGYTLQSVTMPLEYGSLGSTTLEWAIRTSTTNSSNEDVPSDTIQATLTGSTPTEITYNDFTYTCAGSGCTLSPDTTYFLYVTGNTTSYLYHWQYTSTGGYTTVPSGNGWSIGTGWYSQRDDTTSPWKDWASYGDVGKFKVSATAKP